MRVRAALQPRLFAEQITAVSGKSVVKTVRSSSGRGSGGGHHETSACIRHISEHSSEVLQEAVIHTQPLVGSHHGGTLVI